MLRSEAVHIKKGVKAIEIIARVMTYLRLCKLVFTFSGSIEWRVLSNLRRKLIRSMYKPKGQIQPQKNLPKIGVAPIIRTKISPFQTAIMDR